MYPLVLNDRMPVKLLEKQHPEILALLKETGIGKVNEKETVHFCGLILKNADQPVFFLPRQTSASKENNNKTLSELTMQVLARYGKEVSSRKGVRKARGDQSDLITLIKEISSDFLENGIYAERIRFEARNHGKPNWARTIKRELPLLTSSGRPVHTNLVTQKTLDAQTNPLALIQAEIIREIADNHACWIPALASRRKELSFFPKPNQNRKNWIRVLSQFRQKLFAHRALALIENLVGYLKQRSGKVEGNQVFGIEDFHTVWEYMLRKVLNNVEEGWNSRLPKPGYVKTIDDSVAIQERGMQTDIIVRHGSNLNILDAKYYEATGIGSVPGWPDIAKQFFYELAVNSVDNSLSISNSFVFPSADQQQGEFREVNIYDGNRRIASKFGSIRCLYVDTAEVLFAFSRHEKSDLSFFNPAPKFQSMSALRSRS